MMGVFDGCVWMDGRKDVVCVNEFFNWLRSGWMDG
jgi:hypothetical protein